MRFGPVLKLLVVSSWICISFGSACLIDAVPDPDPDSFPCATDEDCISGYTCSKGECTKSGPAGPACIDEDGDGYGVGDVIEKRADCGECTSLGECDEDCDDDDADINPSVPESCPEP